MFGKQKCKALQEIRKQIAEENEIKYVVSKCTYRGECNGICPRCEAELRYLEEELEKRRRLGKIVIIAGISMGVCAAAVKCGKEFNDGFEQVLECEHGAMVEPVPMREENE
ncbi:MAG: hypothetical protein E7270_09160 [Lachnospiraceae bacterium]|nr:hypothetical protein [Lachnospiraceae bacterium]